MKRFVSTNLNVQKRRFRRRLISRNKKKQRNRIGNSFTTDERKYNSETEKALHIDAPDSFSLQTNTETMLIFIQRLKRLYNLNSDVYINMREVQEITCGSIALLLSVLSDFMDKGLTVYGNRPKNKDAKRVLERSGFFNFVRGSISESDKNSKNNIICQGKHKVMQRDSAELVMQAMETVSGQKVRNQKIQSMLIEMMANSVNHAFKNVLNTRWWISASHDEDNNKVSFVFIDNGEGIVNTLGENVLKKFAYKFKDNLDLISSAFNRQIKSRTGLNYRGRGLPLIEKGCINNYFSNFTLITNNVYYTGDISTSRLLKEDFSGTFYFFELCEENLNGA